ncbi:hypothetical protein SprV_0301314700 [Sparganum proliferum]
METTIKPAQSATKGDRTCSRNHTGLNMTDDTFYSFICKDIDGNVTDLNPYSKCDVNGSDAHPLFTYLKKSLVDTEKPDITWNFAKFLVDRKGMPYKRYPPDFAPQDMEPDILHLLSR